jgi:hypothetical protein
MIIFAMWILQGILNCNYIYLFYIKQRVLTHGQYLLYSHHVLPIDSHIWANWQPRENPWCEADRIVGFAREPANSASDLSFLFVAVFLSYCTFNDYLFHDSSKGPKQMKSNLVIASPSISLAFALASTLESAGSFLFQFNG